MSQRLWIITYDIANPKRYRKIYALLRSYGKAVQYSVFECWLSDSQLHRLQHSLKEEIEAEKDRIHLYPLCGQCQPRTLLLGKAESTSASPLLWVVNA